MKQLFDDTDIFIEALCYAGYLWTAGKFCKTYLETSKRNALLFVVFSFIGWLLINIANRWYFIPYIFLIMLNHIIFMGLVFLLFQEDKGKKFLAASILMVVITLVGNFCNSFLSCLALFFRHTGKKSSEVYLDEWEGRLISCISFCLVMLAVYWISKHLISVFCRKPGRWYVLLAVPLLAITAVTDVANWGAANGIMVKSGKTMELYYDQIFSHTEICVLTGLSMFAAGFYVFGMDRIYLEQEKSSQYHVQIAIYKLLEEQYRQSERLRHDMNNHIIVLSGLFQSREWEKMGNYLKNMEDCILETRGDSTGNKAVDALLYQKWKWAKKENIKWECDVQIPGECRINEFELCILFGNIVDNALEACKRLPCGESRFVNIQAKTVKKCFLLEVKNSMNVTEKYIHGFTNKKNPQGHGIGLLNVRDVVYRYNGAVNVKAENGIFVISILMPLNHAAHDIKQTV